MTDCPHNDKSKYVDCAKEVLRLNSLMAGKVLVDPKDLLFIEAQIDLGLHNINPPQGCSPFVALRLALQAVKTINPQPAKEQSNA